MDHVEQQLFAGVSPNTRHRGLPSLIESLGPAITTNT